MLPTKRISHSFAKRRSPGTRTSWMPGAWTRARCGIPGLGTGLRARRAGGCLLADPRRLQLRHAGGAARCWAACMICRRSSWNCEQDMCIGEIATDHNNSKQLIDTYGTFALLYNWFPAEAQEIRQYHRAAALRVFCHPPRLPARGAPATLVSLRANRGDVVAGRVRRQAHQPIFRRQHFRSAGRARIAQLPPCNRSNARNAC